MNNFMNMKEVFKYIVYSDGERLDIGENKPVAIFKYKPHAEKFGNMIYGKFFLIKEIRNNMKIEIYTAEWCSSCNVVKNNLDTLDVQYDIINVDENIEVAKKLNIRNIPVIRLVDSKGEEIKRVVGKKTQQELIEFLK